MTTSRTQKVLESGCSHCAVVNQILQIMHIEYRSTAALLSLIAQSTANMPISISVRH